MTARLESAREDILARISRSLSGSSPDDSAAASSKVGQVQPCNGSDLVERVDTRRAESRAALIEQFNRELVAVGGVFHRASSREAAREHILNIASAHKAGIVIGWNVSLINELGLETKLAEAEIQFVTCCEGIGAEDFTRRVEAADIGVTSVDYALADTGTLVLRAGHGRARSISLLPAVHIAVLKPGQIISGLDDLFPLLAETCERSSGSLDSALTFITGPSRTADIELTLVVGVHGPQELHVILLDEETCAKEGKQCVTFDSSRA